MSEVKDGATSVANKTGVLKTISGLPQKITSIFKNLNITKARKFPQVDAKLFEKKKEIMGFLNDLTTRMGVKSKLEFFAKYGTNKGFRASVNKEIENILSSNPNLKDMFKGMSNEDIMRNLYGMWGSSLSLKEYLRDVSPIVKKDLIRAITTLSGTGALSGLKMAEGLGAFILQRMGMEHLAQGASAASSGLGSMFAKSHAGIVNFINKGLSGRTWNNFSGEVEAQISQIAKEK